MIPLEITKEDIKARDAYFSRDKFIELVKSTCKEGGMDFKEALEYVCEKDILLFVRYQLGARPFAWQFKVLGDYRDGARKQVVCCSRQIGKTKYVVAPTELWRCLFNLGYKFNPTYRNKSQTTVEGVMSRGEEQSQMVLDEIKTWIYDGDEYMSSYTDKSGKPIFGKKYFSNKVDWKKTNKYTLTFKKGVGGSKGQSLIRSVPPTDKIRGYTYTGLVFDECAYIEDYYITSAALPAHGAIGNSVILISTPDRKEGYFYQSVDPDDNHDKHKYKRYMYDLDCIKDDDNEYWSKVIEEEVEDHLRNGRVSDVNREYYCDFTSSNNLYFDMNTAEGAFTDRVQQVKSAPGEYWLGVDLGGSQKSHTVLTVNSLPNHDGVCKRVACWRYPLKKDANIIQDIEKFIFPNFKIRKVIIDYCPASYRLYEQMVQRMWGIEIVQFIFNRTSKPEFFDRFRSAISTGKLITYPDSLLKQEMNSYTDDLKPMKGATDDMIDSWMLSAYPLLDTSQKYEVFTIGGSDKEDEFREDQERMKRESELLDEELHGDLQVNSYAI